MYLSWFFIVTRIRVKQRRRTPVDREAANRPSTRRSSRKKPNRFTPSHNGHTRGGGDVNAYKPRRLRLTPGRHTRQMRTDRRRHETRLDASTHLFVDEPGAIVRGIASIG